MKAAVSASRESDETHGSISLGLTQKNLRRLFPCDTSMVVIIDDRADVWEWSPNLIKVIPCWCLYYGFMGACCLLCNQDDFFVGIGDINSTFLPRAEGLASSVPQGSLHGNRKNSVLVSEC